MARPSSSVTSGAARLTVDAKAITGGRAGDEVLASLQEKGDLKGAVSEARSALEKLNQSLDDVKREIYARAEALL